ncbi:TonB-dependent siderophore receptor [Erythrobacter sp. YT30]|uniref:TonB-dependent receptor plug domain-containing protein n=1 Tax=Erythrobacter sp. YT30 TaxID=1735012 RepID=UPI0018D203F1|nr:TonB-dependent receptor [Erythrobacter sp. YT30]
MSAVASVFAIAFAASTPAHAQEPESAPEEQEAPQPADDNIETYPRAFFDRFFPQTALDLLQRTPGFAIESGAELRGFAGGAGNVLIDGERPTIKTEGLEGFLRRIPADAVERIEVTRGAQRAGETAGQSIVANVIRKPQTVAGTWSGELERNAEGLTYPRGELSVTAPLGEWTTTTRINAFWEQFVFTDFDRLTFDGAGDLQVFEQETLPSTLRDAFIATEAKRLVGVGTLTLNGRFGNSRFYQETGRDGFFGRLPDGMPDRRTDIRFDSEFWTGEFSADWTGRVADKWVLKVLGLGSLTESVQESRNVVEEPVGELATISRFRADRLPLEVLSRGTIGKLEGSFRPEFGVEVAYNRLDSSIALEFEDETGVTPIDLPASDVTVEELRGEAFTNITWIAAPDWTIEAGLAIETSRITVAGDAEGENTFTFLKPSFAITHQLSKAIQLRAAVRRTVGQLDFNDFAASTNLEDDRVIGGNPDLGPDQTTRASFTADFRAPSGAALNVEAFHEWREDVLEQVILPSGVGGLANAGSARVWGMDVEGALPLRAVLPGGLLEVTAEFRDSSFDDPITGETRNINGLQNPNIDIDFRQDFTAERFAYGIRYEPRIEFATFFIDEAIEEARGDRWTAFIETTRFFGLKMNLEVRNIGGQIFPRDRLLFTPDRSGSLTGSEILDRRRGEFVKFTITDQF